jgi:hypothetical protein
VDQGIGEIIELWVLVGVRLQELDKVAVFGILVEIAGNPELVPGKRVSLVVSNLV